MKKLLWLMVLLPLLAFAEQDEAYVDTGEWHISLALGYGAKSNPLVGGDDVPLVLLPEIAYYGESFYFDNGDLGYTLVDTERYSVSVLSRFNIERAYFSFLHPSNILFGQSVASPARGDVFESSADDLTSVDGGPLAPSSSPAGLVFKVPTIDDLTRRKFAIDGGVQLNVYLADGDMLRAELMQDISGVYKGQNALVEYLSNHRLGEVRLVATAGLKFKSSDLIDYYYGIDKHDSVARRYFYQGRSSIQPYVKMSAVYPLTEQWSLVALGSWSKLGSGMSDSPVVEDGSVSTLYAGVSYAF